MKLSNLAGKVVLVVLYLFLLYCWVLATWETIKNGAIYDSIFNPILSIGVTLFILWRICLCFRKEKERANQKVELTENPGGDF
ncbi:MAG: hypothetical protein PHP93_05620 [Kiritimatiellales bacterium]|nr:hypothetical protein [Kiritimatiellales bacterium]